MEIYQYPVINTNGKEFEKECVYLDNWVTLLPAEINTTLYSNYT